jgi:hypothetical protein
MFFCGCNNGRENSAFFLFAKLDELQCLRAAGIRARQHSYVFFTRFMPWRRFFFLQNKRFYDKGFQYKPVSSAL